MKKHTRRGRLFLCIICVEKCQKFPQHCQRINEMMLPGKKLLQWHGFPAAIMGFVHVLIQPIVNNGVNYY
jgi:hypothetical protein